MKYNYVYFDDGAVLNGCPDINNYYYICTLDLKRLDNVYVVSYPLDCKPGIIHSFYVMHNHPIINSVITLPFKSIWYPFFFKYSFKNDKPICFVVSGYYITVDYIRFLKKKYVNSKFVLLHRDLVDLWHKRKPQFSRRLVGELYDIEMSYDKGDCAKYNLVHFDEFESKIDILNQDNKYIYDVFFAGTAKDRLPLLIDIYDYLTSAGINVKYFITGTTSESRIERKNIVYSDKNMNYREMLNCSIKSRCLLEVQQAGAVGYTSRFLEAVMYNRKLITNNITIAESKFFDEKGINIFANVNDISVNFVKSKPYNFNYQGEFSPIHLIEKIDSLL